MVVPPNKDGSNRLCVYCRRVSAVTGKDAYAIVQTEATIPNNGGTRYVSALNATLMAISNLEMFPFDECKGSYRLFWGLFDMLRM